MYLINEGVFFKGLYLIDMSINKVCVYSYSVLLFYDGMLLKVCDFGTAKLVDSATLPDTFIGTPYYLAPEIMEGE